MRTFGVIALVLLLASGVQASDFVDYTLTCSRVQEVLGTPDAVKLPRQMVLWQGLVVSQTTQGKFTDLVLQVGSQGQVMVRYRKTCPTLQQDRTSYRVAAKGRIHLEKGALQRLDGVSLILLEPPPRDGFAAFESRLPQASHDVADLIGWRFAFHHPEYSDTQVMAWAHAVVTAATGEKVDPLLLAALLQIESAYQVDAVSKSGALGLGQLMSFTASGLGYDATDPVQNIAGSAHYLGGLLLRFAAWPDPVRFSLAAYNAGPVAVERCHGVPYIPETVNYVTFVRLVWKELQSEVQRYGVTVAAGQ